MMMLVGEFESVLRTNIHLVSLLLGCIGLVLFTFGRYSIRIWSGYKDNFEEWREGVNFLMIFEMIGLALIIGCLVGVTITVHL